MSNIKLDTKLTTLRPVHAETLQKSHYFFQSAEGKQIIANGWKAAGISEAIRQARNPHIDDLLHPFTNLGL